MDKINKEFLVYGIEFPKDEFTPEKMLATVQNNWFKISKSDLYINKKMPQTSKEAEEFINNFDDCVYCNGLPGFIDYLLDYSLVLSYVDYYEETLFVGIEARLSFPWTDYTADGWNTFTTESVYKTIKYLCDICDVTMPEIETRTITI